MKVPATIRIKKPWKIRLGINLPKFSLIACLLLVLFIVSIKIHDLTQYAFLTYAHASTRLEAKNHSLPSFIYIPSLEISLPIDEVSNTSLFWKSSPNYASHLASSASPGESANTVLYAQNTTDSFGRLSSLSQGDTIIITTRDGATHEYMVNQLIIASPTEVTFINKTDTETLTLYTSYGFASTKRFIIQATPITI